MPRRVHAASNQPLPPPRRPRTPYFLSSFCYIYDPERTQRFRRRLNQSSSLRKGSVSRPNAATLTVGDYVRLRGTVSAGARVLESPMKHVPCVSYRVTVVRVVDSLTAKKKVVWLVGGSTFVCISAGGDAR